MKPGEGWGVTFYGVIPDVLGFDTPQEAYGWCIEATLVDPLLTSGIPDKFREAYNQVVVEPSELDGLPLFQEANHE